MAAPCKKEENHKYKTHMVIVKLFHFYLFNFSYKSDTVVLVTPLRCHCSVCKHGVQWRRQY